MKLEKKKELILFVLKSIPSSIVQQRLSNFWGILQRPKRLLVGNQRYHLMNWLKIWWPQTLNWWNQDQMHNHLLIFSLLISSLIFDYLFPYLFTSTYLLKYLLIMYFFLGTFSFLIKHIHNIHYADLNKSYQTSSEPFLVLVAWFGLMRILVICDWEFKTSIASSRLLGNNK